MASSTSLPTTIIIDEDGGYHPDTLRLRLHTDPQNVRLNNSLTISLYDEDGEPRWLEHPSGGEDVDVIALPLNAQNVRDNYLVKAVGPDVHVPEDREISVGEPLQVIGYPLGFYDKINNLPILRDASMASAYPVPFEGRPHVLIDAELHDGISGGLVMTEPSTLLPKTDGSTSFMNKPVTHFVGIFSAEIGIVTDEEGEESDEEEIKDLRLGVVWFAELIPQIIQGN